MAGVSSPVEERWAAVRQGNGAPAGSETLARIARSARGLRQLLDSIPDASLLFGHDGVIVLANAAAGELVGHPPGDLVGMEIERLVAPSIRAAHRARREAFAAAPPSGPAGDLRGVAVLTHDGREVPVDISLSGIETADAPLMCAIVRDISGEQQRGRQDAALRRIAAAAGTDLPVERLLAMVVRGGGGPPRDREVPRRALRPGRHRRRRRARRPHHACRRQHPPRQRVVAGRGRTRRRRRAAPLRRPAAGDPIRELAASLGHHHAVAVPITVNTRLWGGLMVAAADESPRRGGRAHPIRRVRRRRHRSGSVAGHREGPARARGGVPPAGRLRPPFPLDGRRPGGVRLHQLAVGGVHRRPRR